MRKYTFIYFDDYCYLCSNTIRILNAFDHQKKLKYYGLSLEETELFLQKAPAYILNSDSIVVYQNEHFFIKSEAIFTITKSLGGLFRVVEIFRIIPKKYLDKFYDLIARNRYRLFGKRKNCYLPPKKQRNI